MPGRHPTPRTWFERREPIGVTGRASTWTYNHHGHVDGFMLDTGSNVRFPPHLADQVMDIVQIGDEVHVHGIQHTPPDGDTHIDALYIEAPDQAIEIDVGRAPLHPRRPGSGSYMPVARPQALSAPRGVGTTDVLARLAALEQEIRELKVERHADPQGGMHKDDQTDA